MGDEHIQGNQGREDQVAKVSKNIFVTAAVLTALVFSSGIVLGWYLDHNRVSILQSEIGDLQASFTNLDLENSVYQSLNQTSLCNIYIDKATKFSGEADRLGNMINDFRIVNQFERDDIDALKKKYTTINLQFWLQMVNLKKNCDYNTTTILYFYKISDCDECVAQGIVLDSMKKNYQSNLMVFAIDRDTDLGVVNLLKTVYNVTSVPSIVIDENLKLDGFYNETSIRNSAPKLI